MPGPILNIADLEYRPWGHGASFPGSGNAKEHFSAKLGTIGTRIGAQKLGYNLTVVPPGKRAFPAHNHRVNEEMFFIVEGVGELRIGKETFRVRQGDVIASPPGGPETAHTITNTSSTQELKYLAVSTRISPEFVEYPDSQKFAFTAESPGPDGKPQIYRHIGRANGPAEYWDGE